MATFSIWNGRFIQRKGPMGSPTIGPQWGQTPVTFIIFNLNIVLQSVPCYTGLAQTLLQKYIRDIADTFGKGREGQ